MKSKPFNPIELADEKQYLIIVKDEILHVIWDGWSKWFYRPGTISNCIIFASDVSHYSEIEWPEKGALPPCQT